MAYRTIVGSERGARILAAIAARTKKLKVGTAVLLPALRNAVLLAHQAAMIDQISEGSLILGVGIGAGVPPIRAEVGAAGVTFEKRVGGLMEGFRLFRAGRRCGAAAGRRA